MKKISKTENVIPKNEEQRLHALYNYGILDTSAEAEFDALVKLASYICNTPIATITLLDADRQWYKSKIGIEDSKTPRNIAFCRYTILENKILEVPNTHASEVFCSNPLVTGKPNIRFYAGAPLTTPEGYNVGTICVVDTVPKHLTTAQKESLESLAEAVVANLELRLQKRKLKEDNVRLHNYQKWFSHTKELMCMIDMATCAFEEINNSFTTILGYQRYEVEGKQLSAFLHEEDVLATLQMITNSAENNLEVVEFENRVICSDGSLRWVRWNAIAEGGKWFGDARDITESKRLESMLNESESMAHVGGWKLDLITNELYWTDMLYHIHDMALDAKVSSQDLIQFLHPHSAVALTDAIHQGIETGKPYDVELELTTAKDRHIWVRAIGRTVMEHGRLTKIKGMYQDITEKKNWETKQASLLAQLETTNSQLQQKEKYLKEINNLAALLLNRN